VGADNIGYARNGGIRIAYQVVGDGTLDLAIVRGFVGHLEILWESPAAARFLRAGVRTGACEVRNGDPAGMAVHIGARVGICAEAGEVPVSGTVKDLVVGSDLRFEDRGACELKGVPGEWRLYALAHGA
jgi:class 3 adenylate cyclase